MMRNDHSKRSFLKLLLGAGIAASGLPAFSAEATQGLGRRVREGILLSSLPKRNPDFAVRREGTDSVVYRISSSERVLRLNETALQIWNGCDGTRPMHEIASVLSERFDVPVSRCRKDACRAVAIFRHYGVVTI